MAPEILGAIPILIIVIFIDFLGKSLLQSK
jgi:hypothetical protein